MSSTNRPTDEEILKQMREIKSKEVEIAPLVGPLVDFGLLEAEYANGLEGFRIKIQQLKAQCKHMRAIRKDGNCFYRAFAFRFCETVHEQHGSKWETFIRAQIDNTKALFESTGYDMSILEDFMEPFQEAVNVNSNLPEMFNTDYTSDTIVCFLRILTAAFLKKVAFVDAGEGFV
jgi:ubiquitin thioesterase protein OTUB1